MEMIKYQCSYCNMLYDSEGCCPSCGALSEDAIKINYTENIKERKKELAQITHFEYIYRIIYMIHFFTCLSWFGLWMSIPTTILHLVDLLVMRKKAATKMQNGLEAAGSKKISFSCVIRIMDMIVCVLSMIIMILIVVYAIFPLEFFGF